MQFWPSRPLVLQNPFPSKIAEKSTKDSFSGSNEDSFAKGSRGSCVELAVLVSFARLAPRSDASAATAATKLAERSERQRAISAACEAIHE